MKKTDELTEEKRLDICLLMAIAIKQMMQETGGCRHPASVHYAQRAEVFFYETMKACDQVKQISGPRLVTEPPEPAGNMGA